MKKTNISLNITQTDELNPTTSTTTNFTTDDIAELNRFLELAGITSDISSNKVTENISAEMDYGNNIKGYDKDFPYDMDTKKSMQKNKLRYTGKYADNPTVSEDCNFSIKKYLEEDDYELDEDLSGFFGKKKNEISEDQQIKMVSMDPSSISDIPNPTKKVIFTALDKDPWVIKHLDAKYQTPDVQNFVFDEDPYTINFFKVIDHSILAKAKQLLKTSHDSNTKNIIRKFLATHR